MAPELNHDPLIIPRSEHNISRAHISPNAVRVLYQLHNAGHRACLVGGGVRDLLLDLRPKDFDVATDAHPDVARRLFRNGQLIGRRFRLLHVRFGAEIIEVATFRTHSNDDSADSDGPTVEHAADGRILRDNVYGSIEEDAWRRDFTLNALYYDIADFSVIDYVGGLADLDDGIIRMIGDPVQRYHEDPVRLLRAVRFAAKLDFEIEPETEAPLFELGYLLEKVPAARLIDEVFKLFLTGYAVHTFEQLRQYGLFAWLFPETDTILRQPDGHLAETLLMRTFASTDRRIAAQQPINPAFLYAALMWGPLSAEIARLRAQQDAEAPLHNHEMMHRAADRVIRDQSKRTALPRRYHLPMMEIWSMQSRLLNTTGKKPLQLITHPQFRAGYDFLLLRAAADEVGGVVAALADWWTEFLAMDEACRLRATQPPEKPTKKKPKRRRTPTGQSAPSASEA